MARRKLTISIIAMAIAVFAIEVVLTLLVHSYIVGMNLSAPSGLSGKALQESGGKVVGPCDSEKSCYTKLNSDLPVFQKIADRIMKSGTSQFDSTTDLAAIRKQPDGSYTAGFDPIVPLPELTDLQARGWLKLLDAQTNVWDVVGIRGSAVDKYAGFSDVLVTGIPSPGSTASDTSCSHDGMISISYSPDKDLVAETKNYGVHMIRIADSNWFFSLSSSTVSEGAICPIS